MRINLNDEIWVVTDAQPGWELGDVLDRSTFHDFLLRVRGGLEPSENPTLFSDEAEAMREADERMRAVDRDYTAGENGEARCSP